MIFSQIILYICNPIHKS